MRRNNNKKKEREKKEKKTNNKINNLIWLLACIYIYNIINLKASNEWVCAVFLLVGLITCCDALCAKEWEEKKELELERERENDRNRAK